MTRIPLGGAVATMRLDGQDRVIASDQRIAELNEAAGGRFGQPVALPAIFAIARLARRLGITIVRTATVADGDEDLELQVRAEPVGDDLLIEIGGWRLHDIVDPPAGGFDGIDADFRWQTDAAMRLVALSHDGGQSLLGKPLTRFVSIGDEDGLLPILAAAANREGFDGQVAVIRADGRRVALAASARTDASGRFAGFVGAGRYIAEPVAAVETAEEPAFPPAFSDRLDRALRTPLSRIVAHADSIGAQTDGPIKPEYVEYAYDIASAARHLMGLVDDLVDLQAIERPDFAVASEAIDLADVARRAGGLLVVRASNADVRIERPDFTDTVPAIGEFRRALQILVNLVGNAVRYSPEGGVVTIAAEASDDFARVTVADTGKGIALADHERVFEKFGRVDPAEPGGTGLGLYIARRLARAMGGDLTVDSAPGAGARFTLSLPVSA